MPRIFSIFLTLLFFLTGEAFALVKCGPTDVLFRLNELRDEKALSSSYEPNGLLNEGHRYRDRFTNTFLTRDPLGYIDGPNDYNYVRHNPWSAWDPLGLSEEFPNSASDIGYSLTIPIETRIAQLEGSIAKQQRYVDDIGGNSWGYEAQRRRNLLDRVSESNNELRILKAARDGHKREMEERARIAQEQEIANKDYAHVTGDVYFTKPWSNTGKEVIKGQAAGLVDGTAYTINNGVRGTAWLGAIIIDFGYGPIFNPYGISVADSIDTYWTSDFRPVAQNQFIKIDPNTNHSYGGGFFLGNFNAEMAMILLPMGKAKYADEGSQVISKLDDIPSKLDDIPTTPPAANALPSLRQQYVDEVLGLKDLGLSARAAGADAEAVARMLHAERRALGVQYKDLTPADELAHITARNIKDYGDPLGPSIDWLRKQGKSWEQIIESAARPGGKDLGY